MFITLCVKMPNKSTQMSTLWHDYCKNTDINQ